MARLLLVLLTALLLNSNAYVFDFTFTLDGPAAKCSDEDISSILEGIEEGIDGNLNKYIRENGYPGFVQIYPLGSRASGSPYLGAGKCESCPLDNKDVKSYLRRKLTMRSLDEGSMSKLEVSEYVNDQLVEQLPNIVLEKVSDLCASGSKEWAANFKWL